MNQTERVYKVALFGAIGSGKSSIINLLADNQVADISSNVEPCTRRARWYPISLGEKKFRLWDTMGFGFSPVETKDINPLSPYEQAHTLLRNIPNGIDLILLCARKDGINISLRRLYWLLDSFLFGGRAQIALVLTHFDALSDQLEWWDRNCNSISQRCDIPAIHIPHVCITTVHHGSSEADTLYQRSKKALEALLEEEVNHATPTPLPPNHLSTDEAANNLSTYCQLDITYARTLVEKFGSPRVLFNIVLFGESGVGKSSVINLLAGGPVAKVSLGTNSCTMGFSCHEVDVGSHQLQVWDTVGFNGRLDKDDTTWVAIENAARLIRSLHSEGGVDLLVFCMKGGRYTNTGSQCFKNFHKFLCEGQIPVAVIITNLESIAEPMESWWEENGKGLLDDCGLAPSALAGHACITSLSLDVATDSPTLSKKITNSKSLVQTMLDDAISYGDAFIKDRESWVVSFLRSLAGIMVRSGGLKKMTVKNVMQRCGLSKEHAEALIKAYKKA